MDFAYDCDIHHSVKWVLVTIARYADKNGETWVSAGRVARDCGLAPSSVRRLRSELVKMGRLRKHHRRGRVVWEIVGAKNYIADKRDKRSQANATPFAHEHRSYNDQGCDTSRMSRAPEGARLEIGEDHRIYDEDGNYVSDEIPF